MGIVAVVVAVGGYELLRAFVLRRIAGRFHRAAVRFVREHRIQLESARFVDRVWIREALAQDPRVEAAVARMAGAGDRSVRELRRTVDAYVEEIAPFFSLSVYYRLGPLIARTVVNFCFELLFDPAAFHAQLAHVPPNAIRVYVVNHRANMDPLILAYGLMRHVPLSYAVGEWALVWPLHTLFRAFGSYFVRRGEKDPLYHTVLERFVQLLAGQGAVTGFFPEGGLSRDGALRRPRTGLLEYIVGLRHDQPDREIVFMPVGLNYDRVLEDRILLDDRPLPNGGRRPRATFGQRVGRVLTGLVWVPRLAVANLLRVATRSHRKFGYAAITFGHPLRLSEWPGGALLHTLPDPERKVAAQALADELLLRRVGSVVPALPVPILAEALRRAPSESGERAVKDRVRAVLAELRAAGAPTPLGAAFDEVRAKRAEAPRADIHETFDAALLDDEEAEQVLRLATTMLCARGVLALRGGRLEHATADAGDVLAYYANSIAHHLRPEPAP